MNKKEDQEYNNLREFIDSMQCITRNKVIPFLGGRPKRDKPIKRDDIVNLQIALNSSKSFEEFLNQI